MKIRNALVIPAMLALGAAAMPAAADVSFNVSVGSPSPLRYQTVSAPRANLVWVPGYWTSHHGRHYWHEGYWVRAHRDRYVTQDRWQRGRGQFYGGNGRRDDHRRDADRDGEDRQHRR